MTDKGEISKDLEHEASTSEDKDDSNVSSMSPTREMDYWESLENANICAMVQVLKMSSPVSMPRRSSLKILPGSPDPNAVSVKATEGCLEAPVFTNSSGTPFALSKTPETLEIAALPVDDKVRNVSKLNSLLHEYHNHFKNAKVELEKIRKLISGNWDILSDLTQRIKETNTSIENIDQSKISNYLSPDERNKIRRRELLNVGRQLITLIQISQTEAGTDFKDWKLLEKIVSKKLADIHVYLKISEVKVMEYVENSSSSTSKFSLSVAVIWLDFIKKSLIVNLHKLRFFVIHRKLNYKRIFLLTERVEVFYRAFNKLSDCPRKINAL